MKLGTRYQIREFVGSSYSKQVGRRLRERKYAAQMLKVLKKQGREVFLVPMKIWVKN